MSRLAAVLVLFGAFAGAAQAQAVALVTDLGGASRPAILSELAADSELKLPKEAKLTVLYYSSGHEFVFEGPATIRWRPGEPLVVEGAAPRRRVLTATGVSVRSGDLAPATFVMRNPGARPPAKGAPLSERVVYAVWLEQTGQKAEAARLWKALAAERPDAARLQALAKGKGL